MTSHQNAAKRLKALLRRTHFPVARLKQIQSAGTGASASGTAEAGVVNPWDGIVAGDPRAALIVLHWTLLDMSPLFAANLLDREYSGLQSLPDFKFVSRSLRMLREEFSCRPQLTAEQFLTNGFPEVKMRLLADVVELVMRTHHSLAQQQNNLTSSGNGGRGTDRISEWKANADGGGGSGTSSPQGTTSTTQAPHSRPSSVDSRCSGGGYSALSPAPTQPHSPPLLSGGPISATTRPGSGSSAFARYRVVSSPSALSDEQNAPPGAGPPRPAPRGAIPSRHAPVPRHHDWRSPDTRSLHIGVGGISSSSSSGTGNGGVGGRAGAGGGGGAAAGVAESEGVWPRSPGSGDGPRVSMLPPLSSGRSPLGPRFAQGSARDNIPDMDLETAAATLGMLPPPLECGPSAATGASLGGSSTRRSDWLAVQQAFGSPSTLHMPLPPPVIVPMSPPATTPMAEFPSRSASLAAMTPAGTATHASAFAGRDRMSDKVAAQAYAGATDDGNVPFEFSPCKLVRYRRDGQRGDASDRVSADDTVRREEGAQRCGQEARDSLATELAKMQKQIEFMLEQHARSLEMKIKETEQTLSARLTLLETKLHGMQMMGSALRP